MEKLRFDLTKNDGKIKVLNATNGGPIHKRHATDQFRSNFEDYKNAKIPYSRNHDSGIIGNYGGPYSHDILKFLGISTLMKTTLTLTISPAQTRLF